MEPIQFCYWLQGFAELNASPPTLEQWQAIRDHLQTVFKKVTPVMPNPLVSQGPLGIQPYDNAPRPFPWTGSTLIATC